MMECVEPPQPPQSRPYEVNPWRDATMTTNFGPVVVFHSENHPGHYPVMGAIRLPKMSPHRVSDYIRQNYYWLKSQGMRLWHAQNKVTNNAIGFGKRLALDEFGLTFALQHPDSSYSPSGRNEIGLWALDFPKLVQFTNLAGPLSGKSDPDEDVWELVVNAYVFLLDEKRRRTTLSRESKVKTPTPPPPNGKIGTHVLPEEKLVGNKHKNPQKKQQEPAKRPRTVEPEPKKGEEEPSRIREAEAWKEKHFPALDKPKVSIWTKDGIAPAPPALPEY